MTIRYCSDLHLEFRGNKEFLKLKPIESGADVLILAGDIILFNEIGKHSDFFDYVADNFGVTYWSAGNHEYYHFDLAQKNGSFQDKIRSNVFLVNNVTVTTNGVRFIFSTLWSHIGFFFQKIIKQSLSDFHVINFGGERLTVEEYNRQHLACLNFIKTEFETKTTDKTIVVTHHVPTELNYPEMFKGSELSDAFVVELFDLIESSGADYWLYGHHHRNTPEFTIGKTKLITNQLGYVQHGEHLSFNPSALIEL